MWRFNPAPGWPVPPPGYQPPAGWTPDPSWPAPPPGWQLWIWDPKPASAAPPTEPLVAPALAAVPASQTRTSTPPVDAPGVTESKEAASEEETRAASAEPVIVPKKPGWRERRAVKSAERAYEKATATWQQEMDLLRRLLAIAEDTATGGPGVATPLLTKRGETAIWSGLGSLIEPRRQPGQSTRSYSGVSVRVAPGLTLHSGSSSGRYVPGREVQTSVDSGSVSVTSQRVVFTGGKLTREWLFPKLISIDSTSNKRAFLLHVSNRQKVSGFRLKESREEFQMFLALAVTIFKDGASQVLAQFQAAADAHEKAKPILERQAY